MNIDLVITELDVGGAEQCLTNLAIYLHRRSHHVRVIAIGPPPPADRNRLVQMLKREGVAVHFLGARRAWHSPRVIAKVQRLIHLSRPDLVQSFLFHANVFAALTYSPRRIPVIGGIRVVDPSRRRALMSRLASTRMKYVVCVSQSVADACEIREGIPKDKLVVIQNGVAVNSQTSSSDHGTIESPFPIFKPSCFAQKQLGIPLSTPCLLFVGRMDHQKGIDILLDRADRILRALPQHALILVGDGPLKVAAQSHASQCENERRIHFVGRRDDVINWMRSSQLLLLPTRYEGMPNVVLEAMSCGLPVCSTQAEGILELLGPYAARQAVPVNDWDAWENQVIQLAKDPLLCAELAKANFARCAEQFNLEEKLQEYEQLYLRTVASRAPC